MSWRVLVVSLLLALGLSAWGGIQLGDWLVQHAPQAAPAPNSSENGTESVLDADGRPYLAQPPQPRVDGTLGVPEKTNVPNWNVQTVSLFDTVTDPNVTLSRSTVSRAQAAELAASSRSSLPDADSDSALDTMAPPGYAQQGAIMASSSFSSGAMILAQPNNGRTGQTAQGAGTQNGGSGGRGDWLSELRRELNQCADTGFFERPTCAWNARNRYCAPNQAWGRVAECPQRP